MMFWKFKHAVGKIEKGREKQNDGGWIWDTYRFTFGKGSSFWVWRAGPFSCCDYHCSACPGELDEDELVTLRHAFLVIFVDRVVVGSWLGDVASAFSCVLGLDLMLIIEHCSFLGRNRNFSSFPLMLKRISPTPTSMCAPVVLRNGRPRMSSVSFDISMSCTTKSTGMK